MKNLKEKYRYDPDTGSILNIGTGKEVRGKHSKGYFCAGGYLSHRLAWYLHYGEWPAGQIDHINQIKTDNRIDNLRCVSNQVNHKNMPIQRNNNSGVVGVHWAVRKSRWVAYIKVKTKRIHLGSFVDFFEACCTRKSAENKYGFHRNHGNSL